MQPYTQELLQPWVDAARSAGLSDIAFTYHDRYHLGIDFDEIEKLRANNRDVNICAGIELDNDPASSTAGKKWVEKHWDQLDFVLGSVHFLDRDDQMFDTVPDGAGQFVGRAIDEIYADYFRRVRDIASSGLVDCLAHIDLIKIHDHRPDSAIAELIGDTLDVIASRGLAIELSTAGWRKPVRELYPQDEIIAMALQREIPFTTASDAHSPVQLGKDFDALTAKIQALRISHVAVYRRHKRHNRSV